MAKYKTLELWEYHVVQLKYLFYIQTIALFISLCDLEKERGHTQSETNNGLYIKQIFQLDNMIPPKLQSFIFVTEFYSSTGFT